VFSPSIFELPITDECNLREHGLVGDIGTANTRLSRTRTITNPWHAPP